MPPATRDKESTIHTFEAVILAYKLGPTQTFALGRNL